MRIDDRLKVLCDLHLIHAKRRLQILRIIAGPTEGIGSIELVISNPLRNGLLRQFVLQTEVDQSEDFYVADEVSFCGRD